MTSNPQYLAAINDFRRVRRRAAMQRVLNIVSKQSELLSYQTVRKQLRAIESPNAQLKEIPIEAIKGSVGRYADFTRDFLPKGSVDEQRWARVKTQITSLEGVPPINVYQIGEVYFVLDGNHRVSIAKEMGNSTIEAYVQKTVTKVPLKLDEDIDQILLKAELAEFLEHTQFNQIFPEQSLILTAPGRYIIIMQQIEAIHFALEVENGQGVPYKQAVRNWYYQIYTPIIDAIQEQHLLSEYPERTETDLFLWIFKHRASLIETLGWEISVDQAAKNLPNQSISKFDKFAKQSRLFFQKIIHPHGDHQIYPSGTWRREKMAAPQGRLFENLLVLIDIFQEEWQALSEGLAIAQIEGSQIYGLIIAPDHNAISQKQLTTIQSEFEKRCHEVDIPGQIAFETGGLTQTIKERASWADLLVLPDIPISKEEFHTLVKTCPNPILVIKNQRHFFKRILVVHDCSPSSDEALFLGAYLATFWDLGLSVTSTSESDNTGKTLDMLLDAKEYLNQYGVRANFIQGRGKPAIDILTIAKEHNCDLIILGKHTTSYKYTEAGTLLSELLINSHQSILVCQ